MTTLLRPRHPAGGPVDAREKTLDCCALEHRMLFSAAPFDLSLLESPETGDDPLGLLPDDVDPDQTIGVESDHLIPFDQIPNELIPLDSSNIDSMTGDLRFASTPDFEIPSDEVPSDTDDNVDTVEVTADDNNGATADQAIDLTVINASDLPLAENDLLYASQNTQLLVSVETLIGNDADEDGDRLNVEWVDGQTHLLAQLNVRAIDDHLDVMLDTMSDQETPRFALAGSTMTTAAMSVGYVVWTTRASYMMASLLGATPAWKQIDPLPILEFAEADDSASDGDDRSDIDRLLDDPAAKTLART